MNGCMFLVNLLEVQNSERILQYRSLLKENINFWEEDLTSENQECVTVTEDIEHGNSWQALDENRIVTTWYLVQKFNKRSKYESCKMLLKAGDNDIAHEA